MPIHETADPASVDNVKDISGDYDYLVFMSSRNEERKLWCPDCANAEGALQAAFGEPNAPSALFVYVGQREEWKPPSKNAFREEPWFVSSVPTIIRRDNPNVKLVDSVDLDSLASLLAQDK